MHSQTMLTLFKPILPPTQTYPNPLSSYPNPCGVGGSVGGGTSLVYEHLYEARTALSNLQRCTSLVQSFVRASYEHTSPLRASYRCTSPVRASYTSCWSYTTRIRGSYVHQCMWSGFLGRTDTHTFERRGAGTFSSPEFLNISFANV